MAEALKYCKCDITLEPKCVCKVANFTIFQKLFTFLYLQLFKTFCCSETHFGFTRCSHLRFIHTFQAERSEHFLVHTCRSVPILVRNEFLVLLQIKDFLKAQFVSI